MNNPHLAFKTVDIATPTPPLAPRLDAFRPKHFFQLQCGPYRIETATSPEDMARILDLRHHSFAGDFHPNAEEGWVDFDNYDLRADHVILKHVDTTEILGSYRIICSEFSDRFYSHEQYDIASVLAEPGVKIELGRASVKTISPELAYSMFWHLYPMCFKEKYRAPVLPNFYCPMPANPDTLPSWREIEDKIPSLLKSYLQAGASIVSEPALDTFFNCVDFFTVLDMRELNPKYSRRYF